MGRDSFPWYRTDKRCWYVNHGGNQRRLHADKIEAFRLWHALANGAALSGPSVAELVVAYLDDAQARLAPPTLALKKEILEPLAASSAGRSPAVSINAQAWLDAHPSWGRSRRWLVALTIKAAWRWASRRKPPLIEANPLEAWGVPGPLSRGREAVVPADAHAALLAGSPACYRDVLTVLHATGIRPGEAFAIEACHLDYTAGVVVLDKHKTSRRTNKPLVVVLPPAALDVVKRLAESRSRGPLFRNASGGLLTADSFGRWLRRACRRLGVSVIPYGYRHTLATDALAAGVPDAQVAALLGHSNTAMLHKHYAHLTARLQALKDAMSRVRPGG